MNDDGKSNGRVPFWRNLHFWTGLGMIASLTALFIIIGLIVRDVS